MSDDKTASTDGAVEVQAALERMGALAAQGLDARPSRAGELAAARHSFLLALPRQARSASSWRVSPRLAFVAAAALIVLAVTLVLRRPAPPLAYEVEGETGHGGWLSAPADKEVPIRFSNGSSILLAPGARARVAETDAAGARIEIERGRAAFSIRHDPGARWLVSAGPFEVRVTGTRFDAAWAPAGQVFTLSVDDGSVVVDGPDPHAQPVVAGQKMVVDLSDTPKPPATGSTSGEAPAADEATDASVGIAPAPSVPMGDTPIPPAATPATAAPAAHEGAPWRKLVAEGRWAHAVTAAEASGFDRVCAGGGAADLVGLGDAARLSGKGARAQQAYTVLRQRFPGTDEAALAAFRLGTLAFPSRGAVTWYQAYLSERPGGPLAAEALGRTLEVYDRAHEDALSRSTAEQYLARFPRGGHAALARTVLAR